MITKHTSGPLFVRVADQGAYAAFHIVNEHEGLIATIYRNSPIPTDGDDTAAAMADATLYAAAPDLLVACEAAYDKVLESSDYKLRQTLYRAIVKAKGE